MLRRQHKLQHSFSSNLPSQPSSYSLKPRSFSALTGDTPGAHISAEILGVASPSVLILLLGWLAQYFVYDAVFHRLFGAQIEVSVGVVGNLFHRLASVFSYNVT